VETAFSYQNLRVFMFQPVEKLQKRSSSFSHKTWRRRTDGIVNSARGRPRAVSHFKNHRISKDETASLIKQNKQTIFVWKLFFC